MPLLIKTDLLEIYLSIIKNTKQGKQVKIVMERSFGTFKSAYKKLQMHRIANPLDTSRNIYIKSYIS